MLQFYSASTSIVNSRRAITECMEVALENEPNLDCDLLIIYSAIGHNFKEILSEARKLSPGVQIVGCTGAGVISREGPDESMKALAIMAVKGPAEEFVVAGMDISAENSPYLVGSQLALELKNKNPDINVILFYPSSVGIMGAWNEIIEGIESIIGQGVPIIGGISEDNGKVVSDFQFLGDKIFEKGVVLVGLADPTLEVISQSNHGLEVMGTTFEVTRSEGNRVFELDGEPAWVNLMNKLGMAVNTSPLEVIAFASLALEIPEKYWKEYRSKYLIVAPPNCNEDGSITATVPCPVGTRLWLVKRNEETIFSGADQMVTDLQERIEDRQVAAVFHADCSTRGKLSFNQIAKDRLIKRLQTPICKEDGIPWLGLYAAGQIAPISGDNQVHFTHHPYSF